MNIKDALKTALAHLNLVDVRGKNNMTHQLAAVDLMEATIKALEKAEEGETEDANDHNEQR